MEANGSNEFYRNLSQLIDATERTVRNSTHNYIPLLEDAANYVEAALYSNLIRLYEHNLNDSFFRKVNMGTEDRELLMDRTNVFFERAKATSESDYNVGEVDFHVYQDFRATIHDFGDDTYWLLLGVERYADLISCEHRLLAFKSSIAELRKKARKDTNGSSSRRGMTGSMTVTRTSKRRRE